MWGKKLFLAVVLAITAAPAVGQEIYLCPNCGQYHQRSTASVAISTSEDGLDLANAQRARRGLGPLVRSSQLTAGAISKARRIAAGERARKGFRRSMHLGGSFYGGNKEGVGSSSRRQVSACYLYSAPAGTPAGVGLVQGRGGAWYTCLLIKYGGRLRP